MAGPDDGAERNQDPTQKRLDDARRNGQILTSKEMMVFASMAAGTLFVVILAALGPMTATRWAAHLDIASGDALDAAMLPAITEAGKEVLALALFIAVPVAVTSVLAQAAMGGLHWTNKGYAVKPDKINPLAGFKRMVSMSALVELGKAVAKVALLSAVALTVVLNGLPELTSLGQMPTGDAVRILFALVLQLFIGLTLVLGLIGLVDLLWEAKKLKDSLKMTLDEVKREQREDNGSPEMKGKLRGMQMEISRRGARERAALPDVPSATAIITNPTHFAVAVRYRAGEDDAPYIIATGRDRMAAQVIETARKASVPILRLPPLARALYFTGDIGTPIHEGLYGAVATVLAHIWRIDRGLREEIPEIELPQDLQFDSNGHRPN
ncbi:EscU/YscU/HrcU family type III secretion system export apparatus switch protein [Seohaeicola saemankumensis]|uniref:EscU/YscU/HrcU family type III secretion system export apparatus switch protein n=1 Tax=Seohaeicola saemankumensis TaxID=481181 RepID=UPI001E4D27E5|nr:EscU/YscU/HrcU family type III secretion system export apparatus switch protein [Seohaeicola saemankumensis]MCD1625103.1 EscU/YscU/HrcU family type III secretion system export apparatus switch protein [Seohaeicola saemankumensis]